jgi:hypothetical protein
MAKMVNFTFFPDGLERILTGAEGTLDGALERTANAVAEMGRRKVTEQSFPPVGMRPHPAKRTGRLETSIRREGARLDEGRLVCEVVSDRAIAVSHRPSGDWYYPEILRDELGYEIVDQNDVDSMGNLGQI